MNIALLTFNFASKFAVERLNTGQGQQENLQCRETKNKKSYEGISVNERNKALKMRRKI